MLDFVAQRYGMLPSQLLREGSSLDIFVAEMAQRYQNRVAEEETTGKVKQPVPELTQEELLARVKMAREQNASKNSQ